jgi:hypothetical protein
MHAPRSITAQLTERFIFNFRLDPEALAEMLPASWIEPQVVNGWSVMSYCILALDRVTLAPLPGLLSRKTISCAHRCGVVDVSGDHTEPAVYVFDRSTDLPLITRLARLIFGSSMPRIYASLGHGCEGEVDIQVLHMNMRRLFAATVEPLDHSFESEVFGSLEECSTFIRRGVASYAPCPLADLLARVDLHKEDAGYEPLRAIVEFDGLDAAWPDAKMEFDCAVRTAGGKYRWTYRGCREMEPQLGRLQHRSIPAMG